MNKPIIVVSFRRSGTHFLLETLKTNLKCPIIDAAFHPGFDLHHAARLRYEHTPIYIYRDPRNVMKSLYNFFKYSDWRLWSGFDADLDGVDFSGFLRGRTKLINVFCPHFRLILENPILAWVEHTQWLQPLNKHDVQGKIFSVKYEDLKLAPEKEVLRLSNQLAIPLRYQNPVRYPYKVALNKKTDPVQFSELDNDLLFSIAGDKMKELGYE